MSGKIFNDTKRLAVSLQQLSFLLENSISTLSTSSSAVAERPRDALCPSVVSFNSVIPRAQSLIIVISASDHLPLRTIKCCFVAFGATLRLLVIHFVVVSRQKQTPSLSSD